MAVGKQSHNLFLRKVQLIFLLTDPIGDDKTLTVYRFAVKGTFIEN